MFVAVTCGARSGFSKKKKTTEMAVIIKWRSGSKLMSVLRGWSDRFILKCQERLKKSPNMSGIRELDLSRNRFWNKFLTRVKGLRAPVKARSKTETARCFEVHRGDCVWPLEGSNVAVFVTDVLLGDDNTVCVICDLQRYFNQLEKHSWCENSTSTLPLEKSTMQRIVQKVLKQPGSSTEPLSWVEDLGDGPFGG